ncbi:MAG: hypothetical protein U0694_10700 [Anaerolineae bacterium]
MKRLWLALTAFTAGLWVLVWRTRLRKPKPEDIPDINSAGAQYTAPVVSSVPITPPQRPAPNEPSVPLGSLIADRRRARALQNAGLAVFGVVLGLGIVWLGGRLLFGQEQTNTPQISVPSVALSGCEPAPGDWVFGMRAAGLQLEACQDYYWYTVPFDEFYYNVQLNNYGFHDTPFTLEKPAGVYRILIIGDSFPRGEEVPLTNGFPYLLERQFNVENDGSYPNIEVINLGIPALGTDRELLLYAGLGFRFQADVVLLCMYTGNDIRDNDIDLEQLQYSYRLDRPFFTLDNGVLTLHNSDTALEAGRFPDDPAWQWFVNMQTRQTPAPPENLPQRPIVLSHDPYETEYPVDLGLYLPEDSYWTRSWQLTERLLAQFRDLVEAQGSRFGVVIIPDRRAVHQEDWVNTMNRYPIVGEGNPLTPIARLSVMMQDNGITNLNLTTALRAHVVDYPNNRLYYASDGHFNISGHVVAEQAIHDWLLVQGMIPAGG